MLIILYGYNMLFAGRSEQSVLGLEAELVNKLKWRFAEKLHFVLELILLETDMHML